MHPIIKSTTTILSILFLLVPLAAAQEAVSPALEPSVIAPLRNTPIRQAAAPAPASYCPLGVSAPHLINWWRFSDEVTQSAVDFRGVNNAGTIAGDNAEVWTNFCNDDCWYFNLDDDPQDPGWVEVPHHEELNLGTADFTIEATIRPYSDDEVQSILDKRIQVGNYFRGYHLYLMNGYLGFQMAGRNTTTGSQSWENYEDLGGVNLVADGGLHHVAVTVDRQHDEGRLYVDGQLRKTFVPLKSGFPNAPDDPVDLSTVAPLRIGGHSFDLNRAFSGEIHDVAMYRAVAHDAAMIQKLATKPKCGGCIARHPALTAYYPLDEVTSLVVRDAQGPVDSPGQGVAWPDYRPSPGYFGAGLEVGADSGFLVPDTSDISLGENTFTIALWIRPTDLSGVRYVLKMGTVMGPPDPTPPTTGYSLRLDNGTPVWTYGAQEVTVAGLTLQQGNWYHIAILAERGVGISTGRIKIVSGSNPGTIIADQPWLPSEPATSVDVTTGIGALTVGMAGVPQDNKFVGEIDELVVYKHHFLSTLELNQLRFRHYPTLCKG